MFQPAITPADIARLWLDCPHCGWQGTGEQAIVRPCELVRCPECGVPLEIREKASERTSTA